MITTWMLYSLLVAALVAAGAAGLDAAFRLAKLPVRWVWSGAMLLTVSLVALAPGRVPEPLRLPMAEVVVSGGAALAPAARPAPTLAERLLSGEAAAMRRLQSALAELGGRVPEPLGQSLLLLWAAGALAALAIIGSTHGRFHRQRRRWPASELLGRRVRVAPDVGPAVMGVARPEIVVPRWFLHLDPAESGLVLAHEGEHIRARDPLLLTLAWSVAALLLWNPAVWWMLSRLRLAVELDCESRVIRRGADPRSYGSLLIDLAGRSSPLRFGMLALADPPSQLERRLLAMTYQRTRSAAPRAGALGGLALGALLAACAAELPTAAQIQQMDVADAETAARSAALGIERNTIYTLDGVVVTAEQARAVAPERIATMAVTGAASPETPSRLDIVTKMAAAGEGAERVPADAGSVGVKVRSGLPLPGLQAGAVPVLFIDGVRKAYDARTSPFGDLRPEEIESISVV